MAKEVNFVENLLGAMVLSALGKEGIEALLKEKTAPAGPTKPVDAPEKMVLKKYRSARSGELYNIYVDHDMKIKCTCMGFFYRGECKHVRHFKNYVMDPIITL